MWSLEKRTLRIHRHDQIVSVCSFLRQTGTWSMRQTRMGRHWKSVPPQKPYGAWRRSPWLEKAYMNWRKNGFITLRFTGDNNNVVSTYSFDVPLYHNEGLIKCNLPAGTYTITKIGGTPGRIGHVNMNFKRVATD